MFAITTQPIPTFAGTIPAGVELRVVSWGEDGAANLAGVSGWPRVSLARWETFRLIEEKEEGGRRKEEGISGHQPSAISNQPEEFTTETQRHGAEEIEQPGESACRCDTSQAVIQGPFVSGEATCPESYATTEEAEHSPCSLGDGRSVATTTPSVPLCLSGENGEGGRQKGEGDGTQHSTLNPPSFTINPQPNTVTNAEEISTNDGSGVRSIVDGVGVPETAPMGTQGLRGPGQSVPAQTGVATAILQSRSLADRQASSTLDQDSENEDCPFEPTDPRPSALSPSFDPNDELQLIRTPRESRAPVVPVTRRGGWPICSGPPRHGGKLLITTGFEWPGPRFNDHPQRTDWGPEWTIAEVGFQMGVRTVFCAINPALAWSDGKPHATVIDLDRGEYQHAGLWVPLEISLEHLTTETRSHGEDQSCQSTTPSQTTRLPMESFSRMKSTNNGANQKLTFARSATAQASVISSAEPNACFVMAKDWSDSILPTSSFLLPTGFPAPHLGMSPDERRGHRRMKTSDGQTVWHFGLCPGETLADFAAWVNRLTAFFASEEVTAKMQRHEAAKADQNGP